MKGLSHRFESGWIIRADWVSMRPPVGIQVLNRNQSILISIKVKIGRQRFHFVIEQGVAVAYQVMHTGRSTRYLFGFVAGFFATLVFQQLTWWVLWCVGLAPFNAFSLALNTFGVPEVLSHAFWGGLWGVFFSMLDRRLPARIGYWATAFLFGAVLPSAVGLFVVLPLKGNAMGGGWHLSRMLTAFLSNGAWGIGTGLIIRILTDRSSRRASVEP